MTRRKVIRRVKRRQPEVLEPEPEITPEIPSDTIDEIEEIVEEVAEVQERPRRRRRIVEGPETHPRHMAERRRRQREAEAQQQEAEAGAEVEGPERSRRRRVRGQRRAKAEETPEPEPEQEAEKPTKRARKTRRQKPKPKPDKEPRPHVSAPQREEAEKKEPPKKPKRRRPRQRRPPSEEVEAPKQEAKAEKPTKKPRRRRARPAPEPPEEVSGKIEMPESKSVPTPTEEPKRITVRATIAPTTLSGDDLVDCLLLMIESGGSLWLRKVGDRIVLSDGGPAPMVKERRKRAMTEKEMKRIAMSDAAKEFQDWWSVLTWEEKKSRAKAEGVDIPDHDNAKVANVHLTKAMRKALGIKLWKPEYNKKARRDRLLYYGTQAQPEPG